MASNSRKLWGFEQVRAGVEVALQTWALPVLLGVKVRTKDVQGHDAAVSNAVGEVTAVGVDDEGSVWVELLIPGVPHVVSVFLSEIA